MSTFTSKHLIGLLCVLSLLSVPGLADTSTYCQVAGSSCLAFDGIDDYVNLGNNPSLQVTGNMSICAWVQLDATNPGQYWGIAGKLTSTSGFYYKGYALVRYSNNRFRFVTGNGVLNSVDCTQDYTDTDWHHVVGVLEGGRMKIYVDGVFQAQSGTGMSIVDSGQFAFIGRQYSDLAYRFFKGRIDDVRIYNTALSAGQVTTAMTTVPTGPVAGLVGYWNLDEGAGQTVYDLSGNNNHGVLGSGTGVDSADPAWYDVSSICPRQRTYYVDAVNGNDSYSGQSPTNAFKTIQRGINVAANGDTVMVLPGQYIGTGNKELDFGGKAITVKAQDGPAATVINCQGSGRAFYFHSGEGQSSVVDGFAITGGNSATGAAIYCVGASPTISNCWIYGNTTSSTSSGIVYCLNNANAVLVGCTIYSNSGASAAVRFNNSAGQIVNCLLFGNTSTTQGGAIRCDNGSKTTTITNCTVVGNSTTSNGGGLWVRSANAQAVNSIFWGNQASAGGHQMAISSPATLTVNYSDVQGGRPGVYGTGTVVWGTGNIDQDPLFADPDNLDYHLKSQRGRYWPAHQVWVLDDATSPCIDAGDPASPIGDEPQPNGNRINMGAFGGTAYASLSPTGEGGIQGDVNHDGVIDFNDLFALIDMWLNLYAGEIQFLEPM